MGNVELRLRALAAGIDYRRKPPCHCGHARVCVAVRVTAEAFPRCFECVKVIPAEQLPIEDRFIYLALVLMWRTQGFMFGAQAAGKLSRERVCDWFSNNLGRIMRMRRWRRVGPR